MSSSVPIVIQSASESLEDLRRKRRAKIDKMNVSSDSRKRSRSNDITLQRRLSGTPSVVCEPVEGQRTAAKQAHSSSMAYKYALQGLDRNFSSGRFEEPTLPQREATVLRELTMLVQRYFCAAVCTDFPDTMSLS